MMMRPEPLDSHAWLNLFQLSFGTGLLISQAYEAAATGRHEDLIGAAVEAVAWPAVTERMPKRLARPCYLAVDVFIGTC
jgi:hypothetical protein